MQFSLTGGDKPTVGDKPTIAAVQLEQKRTCILAILEQGPSIPITKGKPSIGALGLSEGGAYLSLSVVP
eukprot:772378-Prorocentrum_minimum.AAC.1